MGRRNNRTTNKVASSGSRGVGETQPWVHRFRSADPLEQKSAYAGDAAVHPGEPSIASALDLDGASQATWVSRIHNLTTLSRVPQSFYSMPLKKMESHECQQQRQRTRAYTPHPRCSQATDVTRKLHSPCSARKRREIPGPVSPGLCGRVLRTLGCASDSFGDVWVYGFVAATKSLQCPPQLVRPRSPQHTVLALPEAPRVVRLSSSSAVSRLEW